MTWLLSSDPGPLFIPQRWRINSQVERRDVVRQCVVEDGRHDVGSQRGQVDHSAYVASATSLIVRIAPAPGLDAMKFAVLSKEKYRAEDVALLVLPVEGERR